MDGYLKDELCNDLDTTYDQVMGKLRKLLMRLKVAHKIISDSPILNFTGSVPFPRSYWVIPGKLLAQCYLGLKIRDEAHNFAP